MKLSFFLLDEPEDMLLFQFRFQIDPPCICYTVIAFIFSAVEFNIYVKEGSTHTVIPSPLTT